MNQFPDFIDITMWEKRTPEAPKKGRPRMVPMRTTAEGSLEKCRINVGDFVKLENGEGYHYIM